MHNLELDRAEHVYSALSFPPRSDRPVQVGWVASACLQPQHQPHLPRTDHGQRQAAAWGVSMGLVQLQREEHTHRQFSSTCTHAHKHVRTHSHVILGFSHSGDHMISYQCEIDGDAATYSLHTYTLHWWWFDLHKPLRHVRLAHSIVLNTAVMIWYVSVSSSSHIGVLLWSLSWWGTVPGASPSRMPDPGREPHCCRWLQVGESLP